MGSRCPRALKPLNHEDTEKINVLLQNPLDFTSPEKNEFKSQILNFHER